MSNMYYYQNNNGGMNSTQLKRDSEVYQPNSSGYDMNMINNMQYGNADADSTRRLNRHSTVFIPVQSPGNNGQNSQNYNVNSSASGSRRGGTSTQAGPGQPQMRQMQNVSMNSDSNSREQWAQRNPGMPGRPPGYIEGAHQMQGEGQTGAWNNSELEKACQLITHLKDPSRKYDCFKELNNMRDYVPMLAPILWFSTGTVSILLQEIVNIYPFLSPPTLTRAHSERICNVLGLFQCIVLHKDTKSLFLQANLHLYLYPLINKIIKQQPFEHLRVTSLGVIGALVKTEDTETITTLVNTEIIVLCLRIMKKGNELSRTVATFIVQKILMDDAGLTYICQTDERLLALAQILKDIIEDTAKDPNANKDGQRLLRHVIRCLLRLSENPNANKSLASYIPECIRNPNNTVIKDDQVKKWYLSMMKNLRLVN